MAGWLNRQQQTVIDYLIVENRVLKEQLEGQRLRFTDEHRNILKRHGIEPVPEREKRTSWTTFLKSHWDVMAATDFFTVEVWTLRG